MAISITFAVLFTLNCPDYEHIPKLLGYSSALFLGSVLAFVPVLVGLHTQKDLDTVADQEANKTRSLNTRRVNEPTLTFVRTQFVIVTILMIGAFICMFIAMLLLGNGAPAIMGFSLIIVSVIWTLLAYSNRPATPKMMYIIQVLAISFLVLINVIFGKLNITDIQYKNHCLHP